MEIKFHCTEDEYFPDENHTVRAFIYNDYSVEPHDHDFYEMHLILSGKGVNIIEGERFEASRGDVFMIPPSVAHSYVETDSLQIYHILFKRNFIEKNRDEAILVNGYSELTEMYSPVRKRGIERGALRLTDEQIEYVLNDVRMIENDSKFSDSYLAPIRNHTVWKILYYLSQLLYEQLGLGGERSSASKELPILNTLSFIHENYSEKITVDRLAERIFLSRSTFQRRFRSMVGCYPIEYLNRYRVKRALEMLEIFDLSKTEIAHICGFYDLSHMEKMIKRIKKHG